MNTPDTTPDPQDDTTAAQEQPQDAKGNEKLDNQQDSTQKPHDETEQHEEDVDWAKITKTRSEAAGLRRRLRDAEAERDKSAERIAELETRIQAYEEQEQQREVESLRRRLLADRNMPEGAIELLTATTEDELNDELDRISGVITALTPRGPSLRPTSGETRPPADWSSIVKGH